MESAKPHQRAAEPEAAKAGRAQTPWRSGPQYRAIIDSMSDGIYVVDAELRLTLLNQALRRWLERWELKQDVVGRTVLEAFPFLPEEARDDYRRVFETGRTVITEEDLKVNGKEIHAETHKIPIVEGDRATHVVTIIRDITERKRTEEEGRRRAETLALANSLNDAINRGDDFQEILDLLSRESSQVFQSLGTSVCFLSDDRKCLTLQNLNLQPAITSRAEKLIGKEIPAVTIHVEPGGLHSEILKAKEARIIDDPAVIQQLIAECIETKALRKLIPQIQEALGVQAIIAAPLILKGEVIGLLELARGGPFTTGDLERAKAIADQLAAAIKRKQAGSVLEQRAAQLALLNDIGGKIAAVLDLGSVLERTARLVQESFGYHHAAVFTMGREGSELVMRARSGSFAHLFPPDHRLKLGQGMVGWVGQHGETLLANDVDIEPHFVNLYPDIVPTASELSVPIRLGKEILGVLDVQSSQRNAFDENDVMVMETLADQIAVAIENARLYETVQQELAERKRAEKDLAHYAAELERSNRDLEQFAYVASHDLQEPLRMVTSYLQLLERRYQGKFDQDADDFIAYAVDGACRMQKLINDLLTYSRVSTRAKRFQPTDCSEVLDHALANLKVAIEESGAVVTSDDMPTLIADEVQLIQMLQNLIGNSIKFCQEGPPRVHVSARLEEDEWVFSVRDNGIGIAPQHLDRIFYIFQRLHTREEYPGTGIGLAVCKKIAERHGGRIWVESEPGKGSTFHFTIPDNRGGTA